MLDRDGLRAFSLRLNGDDTWPDAQLLSRLAKRRDALVMQAETFVRQHANSRCLPNGLRRMLARRMPDGFKYFNVGHSNLTERVLRSVQIAGGDISVMVHDVIPLEYPEFQRPGTVKPFERKLRRVSKTANRIIYNSSDTQMRTEAIMSRWGSVPMGIVAHLGAITSSTEIESVPSGPLPDQPYFIAVGTIEPRKNHGFLLDLWEKMGPEAPPLLICGRRGWNNEDVFSRLDHLPPQSAVKEHSNLSDQALMTLVRNSAGLLFPSHAEGYGLPPIEALSLGTRVLCNDLPVLREVLGTSASFAPVLDADLWLKTIKNWQKTSSAAGSDVIFDGPTWADHFKTVLRLT
ncbi:glycosyltransferase involved in cell wall biosynthesis [Sulfitobacter noctilucicola]|uniref:Glycosyltransferase involved in cell wall biosynthesis n=1 Tax=Sulfitobacter noctilucicola TaxID=1342301 RepID=A0A7W6M5A5_9RHOB|nr:glycosyltransferase involved in cell wall biosynthesis [Sulfitobacter noctilucicola]